VCSLPKLKIHSHCSSGATERIIYDITMLSYEAFMSSGKHTASEIIAFKRQMAEMRKTGNNVIRLPQQPYAIVVDPFVIPPTLPGGQVPITPSTEEIVGKFSSIRYFYSAESIRRVVNGKETLLKNELQSFATGALDNLPGTCIGTAMARKGLEGNEADFKEVTKDLGKWYYGGGTLRGLMERLHTQMGDKKKGTGFPNQKLSDAEKAFIHRVLPIDKSSLKGLVGISPSEANPLMSDKANAGAPWCSKDVHVEDVIEEIVEGANHLYKLAVIGYKELREYLTVTNRAEGVVMLKNKRELQERSKFLTKVRPYYVFPGKLRYIFAAISDSYSNAKQNFQKNSDSISAFKFSWMYGGAIELTSWIATRKSKGSGLYALSWGDDQLWVVVCVSGETVVFCPDVVGMDMHLGVNTMTFATEKIIRDFGDKMDLSWQRLTILHGQYAHNHPTLVHHSLVFNKGGVKAEESSPQLSSGVNLTTYFDEVGSARIVFRAKPILSACKDANDAINKFQLVRKVVQVELGMTFKEETCAGQIFDESTMELHLPFLGMTAMNVEIEGLKALIPIPDIPKLSASLFYSKYSKKDEERFDALLSKCVGLCASGGYVNRLFYHVCRRVYEYHSQKAQPSNKFLKWTEGVIPKHVIEFLDHTGEEKTKPFPSRRWFLSLYLDPTIGAVEREMQIPTPATKDTLFTDAEIELLKQLELEETTDWVEIDARSGSVPQGTVDYKHAEPVVSKTVPKEKAGLMPPNYLRREEKLKKMQERSKQKHRVKLKQWSDQKASNDKKYKGKEPEELVFEPDYEADEEVENKLEKDAQDAAEEQFQAEEDLMNWRNQMLADQSAGRWIPVYDSDSDAEEFDEKKYDASGFEVRGRAMEDPD